MNIKNSLGLSFDILENGSVRSIEAGPDQDQPQIRNTFFKIRCKPLPAEKNKTF